MNIQNFLSELSEKEHLTIADSHECIREMLSEGAVLLKNESRALPLKRGERIALFGEAQLSAYDGRLSTLTKQRGYIPFGAGSSKAFSDGRLIAPLDALRGASERGLVSVFEPLAEEYEKNSDYTPTADMIAEASANAETAIVFIRRWAGECRDMKQSDWSICPEERSLLISVCAAFSKVIVVLNTSGPIDTAFARGEDAQISVDALLFTSYGGMMGGLAISDVLTGERAPSGKLPTTFAKSLSDYPSHKNYGGTTVAYEEGIYLGYRYFDTFANDRVAYGFGYGLSYTDFEIEKTHFSYDEESVRLKISVKNVGSLPGKEVVQVYFSSPDDSSTGGSAAHALCAYAKTALLEPGASEELDLSFPISRMRRYDDSGECGRESAYVLLPGDYRIFAGNSLADAKEREVGRVKIRELTTLEQLTKICVPTEIKSKREGRRAPAAELTLTDGGTEFDIVAHSAYPEEMGAVHPTQKPRIERFCGYLYDKESAKWHPYQDECLANMWMQGAYAIIKFISPITARYEVSLRMASAESGGSYKLYYSDDNTNFSPLDISFSAPSTKELSGGLSDYYAFMDFTLGCLELREGENYIKIERTGSIAPNLSLIRFAEIGEENGAEGTQRSVIRFERVLSGDATLDEYCEQMTSRELAEFFVSYQGRLGSEAGGSDALTAKYGHRRINMTDGPAGLSQGASSWPCETVVAASFNTELTAAMGAVIGKEARDAGYDLLLAPGLNLHRYPLCGRNNEYFSEDPYLTGTLAAAFVRGVQSTGTGACVKHFISNEQETDKLASNSLLTERALRELYLYAFEIAIKDARPVALMTSYNHVNGRPASASADLLITVLRGEWGFDGMITGDWNNDKDIVDEINGGNGVRQPAAFCNIEKIYAAADSGEISRETLLAGAKHLMRAIYRMTTDRPLAE